MSTDDGHGDHKFTHIMLGVKWFFDQGDGMCRSILTEIWSTYLYVSPLHSLKEQTKVVLPQNGLNVVHN
jgi:hypothetical protein